MLLTYVFLFLPLSLFALDLFLLLLPILQQLAGGQSSAPFECLTRLIEAFMEVLM